MESCRKSTRSKHKKMAFFLTIFCEKSEFSILNTTKDSRIPENYVAIDDVKRQLRFLEDLDRQEEELRESREKESLIRMSKNKNSGKETIEKAKEMQRQDAEAKRNRDANAAAIAALSSNKTVKNKFVFSVKFAEKLFLKNRFKKNNFLTKGVIFRFFGFQKFEK